MGVFRSWYLEDVDWFLVRVWGVIVNVDNRFILFIGIEGYGIEEEKDGSFKDFFNG